MLTDHVILTLHCIWIRIHFSAYLICFYLLYRNGTVSCFLFASLFIFGYQCIDAALSQISLPFSSFSRWPFCWKVSMLFLESFTFLSQLGQKLARSAVCKCKCLCVFVMFMVARYGFLYELIVLLKQYWSNWIRLSWGKQLVLLCYCARQVSEQMFFFIYLMSPSALVVVPVAPPLMSERFQ